MEPLPTKLSRVGNSAVIYIPMALAKFLKFEAGQTLHVRIVPNGEYFDAPVRAFGRGSLAVLVPRPVLVRHGLTPVPTKKQMDEGAKWDGETIDVPFGDWTTVVAPAARTAASSAKKATAARSKKAGKTARKKSGKHAVEDDDSHAHPARSAKVDKKSPHAHGHKGSHGGEDDHHRAYGEHAGRHVLVG